MFDAGAHCCIRRPRLEMVSRQCKLYNPDRFSRPFFQTVFKCTILYAYSIIGGMQAFPRRADAQMHRTLLLDAADQVFSEHGVHVALELVTARAGVSRATLYRNFPDRDALMSALLERSFEALEAQARQVAGARDGLFRVLEHLAALVTDCAPMADHWRTTGRDSPVLAQAQRRLNRLFKPLLDEALSAGTCRPDLTLADVLLVSSMLGSGLRGRTKAQRRSLSRRALALLLGGLRSAPSLAHPARVGATP